MSKNFDLLARISGEQPIRRVTPGVGASMPVQRHRVAQQSFVPPRDVRSEFERAFTALRRHWRASVIFAACVLIAAVLVTVAMPRTYQSTAKIEIDPPGSEEFSLDANRPESTNFEQVIDTESEILKSAELSVSVIRDLHLDKNPAIVGSKLSQNQSAPDPKLASLQLSPSEQVALRFFQSHLQVVPVKNTRVIEIRFTTRDPRLSAEIINKLVKSLIDRNYGTRYDAVMQSSEWLTRQLDDIRQKMEDSNKALAKYQSEHGIADVDDKQNSIAQRMGELNRQLTQAQADRIQMQSLSGRKTQADSLPQVLSDPVVQKLSEQLAEKQAELANSRVVYGSNHPTLKKVQKDVEELQSQLSSYKRAIVAGVETSYAVAKTREALLNGQMKDLTGQMNEMGQYSLLKREAQTNSDLYNRLYARIKEAGIAVASKSSNIRVIDQARILDQPTMPRPMLNLIVGLMVAIVGGIGLALLRESLDNTVRSPEEATECTGIASVALLPRTSATNSSGSTKLALLARGKTPERQSLDLYSIARPRSIEAEAMRGLANSVSLGNLQARCQVVLVVSPFPTEGKSTVAANLAVALSELGSTCLVDCDLRQPVIAGAFGVPSDRGLSTVLSGHDVLESVLVPCPGKPNLVIVPSGNPPDNPGPLVASLAMNEVASALRSRFSFVVIDSPPILPYAEARTLCTFVDEVLLVGRYGSTTRSALARTSAILAKVEAPVVGFVLNGVDIAIPGYLYYQYENVAPGR